MRAVAAVLAAAAAAAVLAACSAPGADGPVNTAPEPPPTGTGYFVGAGADGVGATLDMHGSDPITRTIVQALIGRGGPAGDVPAVGIASVVNDGRASVPTPRFVAVLTDDGGAVPIPRAEEVLRAAEGPAARRALRRLSALPARVPAAGAATVYVVLEGARVAAVDSVRLVVTPGAPITLAARRR